MARGNVSDTLPPGRRVRKGGKSKSPPWFQDIRVQIGGGAAAVLLLLAVILLFSTSHGTLRVEILDPAVEVKVQGTKLTLTEANTEPVSLTVGEKKLTVTRGKVSFETDSFTLKKGAETKVKVDLVDDSLIATSGGKVIGEKSVGRKTLTTSKSGQKGTASPPDEVSLEVASPTPTEGFALNFSVGDTVELPPQPSPESAECTCELWCTPNGSIPNNVTFYLWTSPRGGLLISDDKFRFYTFHGQAISPTLYPQNKRIHLAGVNDTHRRLLFLNGKLIATTDDAGHPNPETTPQKTWIAGGHFAGLIDAVRISRMARYSKNFTPPRDLPADKETVALYRFDEGAGDVLKDSSGNNQHGKIVGAKWVNADGSKIGTPNVSPKPEIPAAAFTFGGHRYLRVESFGTWTEAKAKAEAVGGHLATINSRAERDWILEHVWRTRPMQNDRGTRMFLGGRTAGGAWSWVTGEPFDTSLSLGMLPNNPNLGLAWESETSWCVVEPDNIQTRYVYFLVEWDTLGSAVGKNDAAAPKANEKTVWTPADGKLDLLPLVDLSQDVLAGEWTREDTGLITKKQAIDSQLRLPVEPGEEYTLRAAFLSRRGNVSFILPFESKGLEIFLSGGSLQLCLKQLNDPTNPRAALASAVHDGQRHEVLIEVARPTNTDVRLRVTVDCKLALEWSGSRDQLRNISGRYDSERSLVVGTFLPVPESFAELLEANLTTTKGTTKSLRGAAASASVLPDASGKNNSFNTPAFQQWMKGVISMPAEKQIDAVAKKLVELNPGFDGKLRAFDSQSTVPVIERGQVTNVGLSTINVSDVSPLRAFVGLKVLDCHGGEFTDLSPLKGMPLTKLAIHFTKVSDLAPLQGMKLEYLDCYDTPVSDLSPLRDAPLVHLDLRVTKVSDLSPLQQCQSLIKLGVNGTQVTPTGIAALQKTLPTCEINWDDPAKPK